jgi:hypothetical protein
MQYTIDIDPVTLKKAQQCAEENEFDLNEYIIEKLEEFISIYDEMPVVDYREKMAAFRKLKGVLKGMDLEVERYKYLQEKELA